MLNHCSGSSSSPSWRDGQVRPPALSCNYSIQLYATIDLIASFPSVFHREDTVLMASSLALGYFTPTIASEWPGDKRHFLLESWSHLTSWGNQVYIHLTMPAARW